MGVDIRFTILTSPLPKLSHPIKWKIWLKNGAQAFFLHYYDMEIRTDERQNTDPHELEQLLGEHSDIF